MYSKSVLNAVDSFSVPTYNLRTLFAVVSHFKLAMVPGCYLTKSSEHSLLWIPFPEHTFDLYSDAQSLQTKDQNQSFEV